MQRKDENMFLPVANSLSPVDSANSDSKGPTIDDPDDMTLLHSLVEDTSRTVDDCDQYKIRKIGDRKLMGLTRDEQGHRELIGSLNQNDFKKAKFQVKSLRTEKSPSTNTGTRRIWHCQIFPPESALDPIKMKVKWEFIDSGAAGTKSGKLKLFKYAALEDDDEDLPICGGPTMADHIGLSRHEFFDALLCIVRLSDDQRPLYLLFDEMVTNHFDAYVQDRKESIPTTPGEGFSAFYPGNI